jgi:hypothetical protein
MNILLNKILFISLFFSVAWIGSIGIVAWINFPAVISFLTTYLSPDGELERPVGAFLRVLFAPAYYLIPTLFVLRNFYFWKDSIPNLFLVYYFMFFALYFGVYKYLDINGSGLLAEDNVLEWLTFALSIVASILFAVCAYLGNRFSILLGISWFFFAMEEISWGQRIFDFTSPALFLDYNYQQEFTLHNFLNPVMDIIYVIVNITLLFLLTPLKNFASLQKRYQFLGDVVISGVSEKFALWVFPCVLVLAFIFSPVGQQPYEFVEQQWALLGLCISFLTLKAIKNKDLEIK